MKIDFTDVADQVVFKPLPRGKYVLEVTNYSESTASDTAKNPGAPTISWELSVESTVTGDTVLVDKSTDEEINLENRKVWENMTLVEASFWRLKAFLRACGFDVSGEIDFDPDQVLGSRLVGNVGIQPARKDKKSGEEYQARNVIRSFHEIDEGEGEGETVS